MWTTGGAAIPGNIVVGWVLVSVVAAVVMFVGWWRRGSLDLEWDVSLIVLGCVGHASSGPRCRVVVRGRAGVSPGS
jgi:hypothetical protein